MESRSFICGSHELDIASRTYVMGILNVTPDSFSDGGLYNTVDEAVKHAGKLIEDGADIIDVGGESTKPGALPVEEKEEIKRVVPVIEKLAKKFDVPISIDTYKANVAKRALDSGAVIINDISGLRGSGDIASVASEYKAGLIIMHMKGTPGNMQDRPEYDDVVSEIYAFLKVAGNKAIRKNVDKRSIAVDPGIGFGKKLAHNLEILKRISEFKKLGCVLVVGPSRKSFIGKVLDLPTNKRLEGTIAGVVTSVMNGANIVRVHDCKQVVRAVRIADAIKKGISYDSCLALDKRNH